MANRRTLFLILFITAAAAAAADSATNTTATVDIVSTAVHSRKPATKTARTKYSISPYELDSLLSVLRYSGYPLFSNAIDTSDIQFQILTGHTTLADASSMPAGSFTIFAPRDHFLYTLDMASDADAYVAALRSHVIPSRRLTITELRNLTPPYLDTLLPHYSILVEKSRGDDDFVTVDGIRVTDPNIFVGSRFVVHGLDGILLTGFNMYEDTLSQMGKGFFAPEKVEPFAHKSGRHSASAVKNGRFSRVTRKHRKLQYRRMWKSNYSVRRNGGEDDF
ncbi:uncharacterized protein LOC107004286 [Solanum pennellii]|uniref:Uncharacterized protein LOC107004286 n=1 Tax=Solanum pennellii TaxID=28526 RepID=A0ABM1FJZ2_SOLPN|nr:uncharacterized protein LOC107004286 [Solanum pennellii]